MKVDIDIITGQKCPYCMGKPELVDSSEVYGESYGNILLCRPCKAWVGVHKGTDDSLGRLANAELREFKRQAHYHFDRIWKEEGYLTRREAYAWLSQKMGTLPIHTHIGMYDEDQCKQVIELCKSLLPEKKVTVNFGNLDY